MQTIYINGVKASRKDLAALVKCIRKGSNCIVEVHKTKNNNVAVRTA